MAIGSGISAQAVYGIESVYGTPVTPDHSVEFAGGGPRRREQRIEDDDSLHGGGLHPRASRSVVTRTWADGDLPMQVSNFKMGPVFRQHLGSTTASPTLISGSAYKQVHQPGNMTGLSSTWQIGRPDTGGTVRPFTYAGVKLPQMTLDCAEGDVLRTVLSMWARAEAVATALVAYSPIATAAPFHFGQLTVKVGGTASTASSVVSIAGGSVVTTLIKAVGLVLAAPLDTDRFGSGGAGLGSEPMQNGKRSDTGSLTAEFSNRSEFYDVWTANTTTPLQFTWVGNQIGATGQFDTIDVIFSAAKFTNVEPDVPGNDITPQPVTFRAEDDGTNAPVQVTIISAESTM